MYETQYTEEELKEQSEALDGKLQAEETRWKLNNFSPEMLMLNAYHMQMKIGMLTKMLERMGVTTEEMDICFKEAQLEQLQHDRAMLMQDKLKQSPTMAVVQSKLLGPHGRPM